MDARIRTLALPVAVALAGGVYFAVAAATGERLLPALLAFVVFGLVRGEMEEWGKPAAPEEKGLAWINQPVFRRRASAAVLLISTTMLLLGRVLSDQVGVDEARQWVLDLGALGPLLLIGVIALAMVFSPIPNMPLLVAAGLVWGTPLGTAYSVIGQVIGATCAFWIARRLGRRHLPRLVGSKPAEQIDRLSALLGTKVVFWARMIPFISFDLTSYAAGLTSMRYRSFIMAAGFGSILPTLAIVYFGESLTGSWTARFASAGLVIAAAAIPAGIWYLRNRSSLPRPSEWGKALEELFSGPKAEPVQDVNGA